MKEETVALLRKVSKAILAEPELFFMEEWFQRVGHSPNCGTAACIGGWMYAIYRNHTGDLGNIVCDFFSERNDRIFEEYGLTEIQANRLFHLDCWPRSFLRAYSSAITKTDEAKVSVERIEHFIQTDGEE